MWKAPTMTAYLVLTHEVVDLDRYVGEYVPLVGPLLEKHCIDVLVGHFGAAALEGTANSVVVLRAESEDALRAFYDDPDYAGPKALRQSITANVNGIIAPEFTSLG